MRTLFIILAGAVFTQVTAAAAPGTTIDRVVVSIGNIGITQSEVEQEVRLARFVDGQPQIPEPGEELLKAARARLIEEILLGFEAEAEGADESGLSEEAAKMAEEVRKLYPSEADHEAALKATGYSQDALFQRLTLRLRILRLIDRRLRPNAWVERPEIEAYYERTFVPEYQRREQTPPPKLEEVESLIREVLTQQEVDQLLDQWLKEIQVTRRVRFHPD